MCAWLEVSKSGFYEWRSRPESATAKRREELKLLVKEAFDDSGGTYGYRRGRAQNALPGRRAGPRVAEGHSGGAGLGARLAPPGGGRPPPGAPARPAPPPGG